ncbi:MAG: hypothetical protein AB2L12_15375 [Smithellaceae bacterium]
MSTLSYSKVSQTYGGIYASGADVSIDSTSQLFGAIIAKNISLSGTGTIGLNPTGSVHIDTGFALLEGIVY